VLQPPAVSTLEQASTAKRNQVKWNPKLGWALSIMLLVILCAAVFHWRAEVIRIWPPSGRILASTGASMSGAELDHMRDEKVR
jgi:hypothetical protein